MGNVRDAASSAEKWSRVSQGRTQDFTSGIQAPRRGWKEGATAAKASYIAGVQASLTKDAWGKGINRTTNEQVQQKAVTVGAARYAPGIAASVQVYQDRIQPYLQVISGLTLPPRGPRGDPRNLERVRIIATALRAKKEGS